jgi:hypothetical protein
MKTFVLRLHSQHFVEEWEHDTWQSALDTLRELYPGFKSQDVYRVLITRYETDPSGNQSAVILHDEEIKDETI